MAHFLDNASSVAASQPYLVTAGQGIRRWRMLHPLRGYWSSRCAEEQPMIRRRPWVASCWPFLLLPPHLPNLLEIYSPRRPCLGCLWCCPSADPRTGALGRVWKLRSLPLWSFEVLLELPGWKVTISTYKLHAGLTIMRGCVEAPQLATLDHREGCMEAPQLATLELRNPPAAAWLKSSPFPHISCARNQPF